MPEITCTCHFSLRLTWAFFGSLVTGAARIRSFLFLLRVVSSLSVGAFSSEVLFKSVFFEVCQTRGPHTVHNLVGFSPASSDPRFLPHELKWRGRVLPSALQLSPIVSS